MRPTQPPLQIPCFPGAKRPEFARLDAKGWRYFDPFSGEEIEVERAKELCGFWEKLIDSNRDLDAAIGFAFWKKQRVAPLLWGGRDLRFISRADAAPAGGTVAVWRSRTAPDELRFLEERGVKLIEVEDGFIRSAGLGADCVPPLSIVVDRLGVHFDPSRPSELEILIEQGGFSTELIARAAQLRDIIVASGLSKYESGTASLARRNDRRHILVPGQVEDDRAMLEGSGEVTSNLDLLRRVRQQAPEAHIIYKPHPDVEAGHRIGAIPEQQALAVADEVIRDASISSLLELADEVHVNSSLAGFEALLREKPVTTYGVPFYAGWGLTRDLGAVPGRRTATRTLDELVAAVLLEYPRYVDPVTGLPCPAEVVVERLRSPEPAEPNLIVWLRRVQGRVMRRFRNLIA